jgi:CheY-like chemotaxis protein
MSEILVVDDVASQQDLIYRALQDAGYTVSYAHGGDEAMQNIELNKPNLIVLDVVMERINGYEVLWGLRENEKTRQIPVVVSSTKNTDFDKAWSFELGADAYVAKPIDANHLVSIVQQLLGTQLMQLQTTSSPQADTTLFFDMLDEMLEAEESISSPIAIADSTPSSL